MLVYDDPPYIFSESVINCFLISITNCRGALIIFGTDPELHISG